MTKLKLTDVEWRSFKIGDIFETTRGKRHIEKNRNKGNIPYYSASSVNNGITDFISNPLFTMKNKILVTTFCDAFYAANTFTASDEMTILDNKHLNKYNGLFISNSIMSNKSKYAFGRKAFTERVREQIIILPIDLKGYLNWQFMEDYIKQEQKQQAQKVIAYYERKLVELAGDVVGLDKVEWKEFLLSDLFDFKRGNQNNMASTQEGNIPLVSAKKFDNGVKTFISDNGKTLFEGNILTLNNDGDGGVGIAYYQPSKAALDTHVTALIPKTNLDKFVLLFISRSITEQREKFSHGYSLNNNRLLTQKIILPADKNGNPDFQYMSDFVKKLELDKVQEVLEYIYIYIYKVDSSS